MSADWSGAARFEGAREVYFALSPDDSRIACSAERFCWLDPQTLETIKDSEIENTGEPLFASNGPLLVTRVNKNMVYIDEERVENGDDIPSEELRDTLDLTVDRLSVRRDATLVVSGNADAKMLLWDVPTGSVMATETIGGEAVANPRFSPDGKLIAVTADRQVAVYEVRDADHLTLSGPHCFPVCAFDVASGEAIVACLAFDSENARGKVTTWDVASGQRTVSWSIDPEMALELNKKQGSGGKWKLRPEAGGTFFRNERNGMYLSVTKDRQPALRTTIDDGCRWQIQPLSDDRVSVQNVHNGMYLCAGENDTVQLSEMAESDDGKWLKHSPDEGLVAFENAATGRYLDWNRHVPCETEPSVSFHPRLPLVACGLPSGVVAIYDVENCGSPAEVTRVKGRSFSFSPEDGRLWGIVDDSDIAVWDVPDLEEQGRWSNKYSRILSGHARVDCLVTGRRYVVAGCDDGRAVLLDAATAAEKGMFNARKGPVTAVAISDDDSWVAVGFQQGSVHLFLVDDPNSGHGLKAHDDSISSIAFSHDGSLLATASHNGAVAIWRTDGTSYSELLRLEEHYGSVVKVAFAFDDKSLFVLVKNERGLRTWRLDQLNQSLSQMGLGW